MQATTTVATASINFRPTQKNTVQLSGWINLFQNWVTSITRYIIYGQMREGTKNYNKKRIKIMHVSN